jgi:hypothetical protein
MSKIENVNISFGDKLPDDPIVVHILEGVAPEPRRTDQVQKFTADGMINSAREYLKANMNDSSIFEPDCSVILYSMDPQDAFIKLKTHKSYSHKGVTISGNAKANKRLSAFYFNKKGVFDNESFIETIRANAMCFKDEKEAKKLVKELSNFKASFSTEVEKLDDKAGNTKNMINTILNVEKGRIPESLTFSMPLVEGNPSLTFDVDVEIHVDYDKGSPVARFGFYSMEIETLIENEFIKTIDSEIAILMEDFPQLPYLRLK